MLPRINYPEGIKTADYLWNDEYWDLKEILGIGNNTFYHAIEGHKNQACNFIFYIKANLSRTEIEEKLNKLFSIKSVDWLNIIIIKSKSELLIVRKSSPSD